MTRSPIGAHYSAATSTGPRLRSGVLVGEQDRVVQDHVRGLAVVGEGDLLEVGGGEGHGGPALVEAPDPAQGLGDAVEGLWRVEEGQAVGLEAQGP